MITNFEKTPVYMFFTDLYKIIKTVLHHMVQLLLANYKVLESDKPISQFNPVIDDAAYEYKPLPTEKHKTEIDFLTDIPIQQYGEKAIKKEPLMAHNSNDNSQFSYDIIKPSPIIEPQNTINLTENFTKPNIDYKRPIQSWNELDYVNRPWFTTEETL
tara:strand:+ start:1107 stop:1580 length:474 start_codon:yes stop_codon:yes gene_type:complete